MQGLLELMSVLVTVNEGTLEGALVQNEYGDPFYSFQGVPYAQPPLGDLRFKPPQPYAAWDGVRSAKQSGPYCYQPNPEGGISGSEDCLFLNVYSPNLQPEKPLPVMFWIHGGAYVAGSGDEVYFGPQFLIREEVVIVTINYRLEVLGFLCLDTEDIPGNAGMKDQVAALRWVKKNIAKFGGDPDNITIFGQSAGAFSVGYHLVSPMTKGLFKRAIAMSGSALNSWALAFEPRERALALARQLGFYSEDDKELYEFFKNQPAESFVDVSLPILLSEKAKPDTHMLLSVVAEKQFGNEEIFFAGDFNSLHDNVEIMLGYTSEEGVANLGTVEYFNNSLITARDFPEFFVSRPLTMTLPINQQLKIGKQIRQFYYNDKIDLTGSWEGMSKFYSMDIFQYQVVQSAKLYANRAKVYLYRFSCKTERNILVSMMGINEIIGETPVTAHADDLLYFFDAKFMSLPVDMNSETFQIMQRVIKLWTNFAKYGNPTPDNSLGAIWKPYTLEDQDYFEIGNVLSAGTAPDDEDIQFWETIYNVTHSGAASKSHNILVITTFISSILYLIQLSK